MLLPFLANIRLLTSSPISYFSDLFLAVIILIPAMLLGFTIHELSHALVASKLGDDTAKRVGRISLNPLAHLDPVGTLMLLLAGFGWAKPVPVNPYNLRGSMTKGMALVSLAGPVSNLLLAAAVAMLIRFGPLSFHPGYGLLFAIGPAPLASFLTTLLVYAVYMNLILAVFNLIPIAPLDGFKVALAILPRELAYSFAKLEQYGMAILMLVFFLDISLNVGIFGRIINPIISALFHLFIGPASGGLALSI